MGLKKSIYRLTHWETWPYLVKYIPIAPVWGWYCLRAGTPWFFTPSNPTISFGGFEGETKMEIYKQLPPALYPKTVLVNAGIEISALLKIFLASGLQFPVAVKPDAGMMGFMFRKLPTEAELVLYHKRMQVDYLLQELVDYPLEISVFYYRYPGSDTGTITGLIRKEFLQVKGDGVSTLEVLIDHYPRASFRTPEIKAKHKTYLNTVIPAGQSYILSHALNLSRGGRLVSLEKEKDAELVKVFDKISLYSKHFYYGRYDIKCASIEALKAGHSFSILEYNGCGAEPHHIYGNGNNLFQAYSILFKHWKALYKISTLNHKLGVPYWGYRKGWRYLRSAKNHFKALKKMDMETNV